MESILKFVNCRKCDKKLRKFQLIKHKCDETQIFTCDYCQETLPINSRSEHFSNCRSNPSVQTRTCPICNNTVLGSRIRVHMVAHALFREQRAERGQRLRRALMRMLWTRVRRDFSSQSTGLSQTAIARLPVSSLEDKVGCCAICLEDMLTGVLVKTLPCSHYFHPGCIDNWLVSRANCPLCKTFVS